MQILCSFYEFYDESSLVLKNINKENNYQITKNTTHLSGVFSYYPSVGDNH